MAGAAIEIENGNITQLQVSQQDPTVTNFPMNVNLTLNGNGYGNDNSGALRVYGNAFNSNTGKQIPINVTESGNVTMGSPNLLTNYVTGAQTSNILPNFSPFLSTFQSPSADTIGVGAFDGTAIQSL